MFRCSHHLGIAAVLGALDSEQLVSNACYFGGGTAIVLSNDEYRESLDIDFLVSNLNGYRNLRRALMQPQGVDSIVREGATLNQTRDLRADQYGIRTLVAIGDTVIKFEIVFEGRIELETPSEQDYICGVATLTPLDMVTSKLLANSDRWADDSVLSRDLIDLAMMDPSKKLLANAVRKASRAYHDIEESLAKSVLHLLDRPSRLEHCMQELRMAVPIALIWQRVKALIP